MDIIANKTKNPFCHKNRF